MEEVYKKSNKKQTKHGLVIFYTIFIFILAVIIFSRIYFYSQYDYCNVSSCSMNPTINPDVKMGMTDKNGKVLDIKKVYQDAVFCKKGEKPKHNDIVVLDIKQYDAKQDKLVKTAIIKRVIALGGDKVTIRKYNSEQGSIYKVVIIKAGSDEVEILDEDYVDYWAWSIQPNVSRSPVEYKDVEYEGSFFNTFLSQNIEISSPSVQQIDGTYFYQVEEGRVFYLADNRVDGSDSRDSSKKTCSLDEVRGVVVAIVRGKVNQSDSFEMWCKKVWTGIKLAFSNILDYFAW